MKLILFFFSFLFSLHSLSQNLTNEEKIKNCIDNYFQYDRENIYVQFNKNIYLNSEDIAFKGYIFSKNNKVPNINSSNIELIIYNDQKQVIQNQLFYASNGFFSGGIHLNNTFKTGKYYFRFYTNWMNNFKEDDSFLQVIEIISNDAPYQLESNEADLKTAEIKLFPEGGIILNDMMNTVGIKITDCNKKGIEIKNGVVLDSKSNEVANFYTNKIGNGAFYFVPKSGETYTLKIASDKLSLSQTLPKAKDFGIVLTYNNNLPNNKLMVVVKTNEKGVETNLNKKYTLLIQQDGNALMQEVDFNNKKAEQPYFFNKKALFNGVNTIRLIDENLNEITQRLVYIDNENSHQTAFEAKSTTNDSIALTAKSNMTNAHLSISILPKKSLCENQKNSILGSFYLNAYLENPESNNYVYFDPENKNRKRDMELLMLNQNTGKFLWENIKGDPPKINYPFQKGVTVTGKVEKELKHGAKNKISLVSFKNNLLEETVIDEHNNFKFEHLFVQDSAVFALQMKNERNVPVLTKIEARVNRDSPRFILDTNFKIPVCTPLKKTDTVFTFTKPKTDENAIELSGVVVKNNFKKEMLVHKNEMSPNAKAFKIKDNEYRTVLSFLGSNGFKTGVNQDSFNVYVRNGRGSYLGDSATSPSIYVDNILLFDFNDLLNLTLDQVDEIYIDSSGSSDMTSTGSGTIKIFLKKGIKNNRIQPNFSSFVATNGYSQNIKYQSYPFENKDQFECFGTLNWTPNIDIKDNSDYNIKFAKGSQNEIQVLVEGFSDDGQLISEFKKIPVTNP